MEGAAGYEYFGDYLFSGVDSSLYVKASSPGATFTFEALTPTASAAAYLTQANGEGAKGYRYVGDYLFSGTDSSLYVKGSLPGAAYSYEALAPATTAAAFLTQANTEGTRGYKFIDEYAFSGTISSLFVNDSSNGGGIKYEALTPSSSASNFLNQANAEGAKGYKYYGDYYFSGDGAYFSIYVGSDSVSQGVPAGTFTNGGSAFQLSAGSGGTSYQWNLNGIPIGLATAASLTVYPTAASQGDYSCAVTSAAGMTTVDAGTFTVTTNAWLVNLSARAYAETGANELIAGFVTTGAGSKSVLIRGDGPSLAAFSVTGVLTDPHLTLLSGSSIIASASSWSASLSSTFAKVGAFGLTAGSHDAALLETLTPGPYTAQVTSSTTNNGVALAEVYDADSGAPANRLINLSARAFVGTGANILIGGFVIGGSTPLTVVIRGDGPSLTGFGLTGALANTILTLSNSNGTIATNSGWSGSIAVGSAATGGIVIQPLTAALSAKVGGFSLTAGSDDSAIVATLPPGSYTAQVTGANGITGIALAEIYELR
jgi:hypothetical protein